MSPRRKVRELTKHFDYRLKTRYYMDTEQISQFKRSFNDHPYVIINEREGRFTCLVKFQKKIYKVVYDTSLNCFVTSLYVTKKDKKQCPDLFNDKGD